MDVALLKVSAFVLALLVAGALVSRLSAKALDWIVSLILR